MFKIFNRKKRYVVGITSNSRTEYVEVQAKNKKEAAQIVRNVVLNCNLFPYKNKNDFTIQCKRIKSSL